MKKRYVMCLAAAMSLMMPHAIFAAEVTQNFAEGRVSLSGTVQPGEAVAVQVLDSGKTIDDMLKSRNPAQLVVYNGQTAADANGRYSFSFICDGSSGIYNAYIRALSMEQTEKTEITFINKNEFADVVSKLNAFAESGDRDSFATTVSENPYIFTNPFAINGVIDMPAAMTPFYESVKVNRLNADDSEKIISDYHTYLVMWAINEKRIEAFDACAENIDMPSDVILRLDTIRADDKIKGCFNGIVQSRTYASAEEMKSAAVEAMILSIVRYPNGYTNAKNIMQEYAEFLGIGKSASDSVYKSVAGNAYQSKDELKKAFESFSGTKREPSSGGGGSSGGSSSVRYDDSVNNNNAGIATEPVKVKFTDIDGVAWASEAICALADKNIISGKSETRFYPDDLITREEFVKIIVCAMDIETDNSTKSVFSDAPEGEWYTPYLSAAYENGIAKGIGDNMFGVGEKITRQDMAVMLSNILSLEAKLELSFADTADIADYAAEAVRKMAANGILKGNENNEFLPTAYATRAEAAQMVYNSYKYLERGGKL